MYNMAVVWSHGEALRLWFSPNHDDEPGVHARGVRKPNHHRHCGVVDELMTMMTIHAGEEGLIESKTNKVNKVGRKRKLCRPPPPSHFCSVLVSWRDVLLVLQRSRVAVTACLAGMAVRMAIGVLRQALQSWRVSVCVGGGGGGGVNVCAWEVCVYVGGGRSQVRVE